MKGEVRPTVWIVGTIGLQNAVTSDYLISSGICDCEAVEPRNAAERLTNDNPPDLFLLDISSCSATEQALVLEDESGKNGSVPIALINVDGITDCKSFLRNKKITGIFRKSTPPEVFVRGIQSLLCGEYWFPRETLNHYLDQTRNNSTRLDHPSNMPESANGEAALDALTPRELAVLEALAHGESTEAIATKMHVSINTVKTHLYNLYRKLEVHNRVEAVVWAHSHRHKLRSQ